MCEAGAVSGRDQRVSTARGPGPAQSRCAACQRTRRVRHKARARPGAARGQQCGRPRERLAPGEGGRGGGGGGGMTQSRNSRNKTAQPAQAVKRVLQGRAHCARCDSVVSQSVSSTLQGLAGTPLRGRHHAAALFRHHFGGQRCWRM